MSARNYNFMNSWTNAEAAAYSCLTQATGTVDGKGAYLGYLPAGMADVWAMTSGAGGGNEQTLWATELGTVHMLAEVECHYRVREAAQAWSMAILRATPYGNTKLADPGNLVTVRIRQGGIPQPITLEPIQLAGEAAQVQMLWTMRLGLEIVFLTGGRTAEQAETEEPES